MELDTAQCIIQVYTWLMYPVHMQLILGILWLAYKKSQSLAENETGKLRETNKHCCILDFYMWTL